MIRATIQPVSNIATDTATGVIVNRGVALYTEQNADIKECDRFEHSGDTYEVVSVWDYESHKKAEAKKVSNT